jgi:hypothetical protein
MMLHTSSLGLAFQNLVDAWLRYEVANDYQDDAKLGTTSRPACISAWIQRARSPKWRPNLAGQLDKLGSDFWSWWGSLQPEWRVEFQRSNGDWEVLRKPGANGLVSVLAALFFWGTALGDGCKDTVDWCQAVADMQWVLEQL